MSTSNSTTHSVYRPQLGRLFLPVCEPCHSSPVETHSEDLSEPQQQQTSVIGYLVQHIPYELRHPYTKIWTSFVTEANSKFLQTGSREFLCYHHLCAAVRRSKATVDSLFELVHGDLGGRSTTTLAEIRSRFNAISDGENSIAVIQAIMTDVRASRGVFSSSRIAKKRQSVRTKVNDLLAAINDWTTYRCAAIRGPRTLQAGTVWAMLQSGDRSQTEG